MSTKKYYAVKHGKQTGIFESWSKCKEVTSGFSGAIFKSFLSKEEALAFMEMENPLILDKSDDTTPIKDTSLAKKDNADEILSTLQDGIMITYIDGSYDNSIKCFSYAGIMFYNGISEDFAFASFDKTLVSMRNVSGEVKASMYVIQKAIDMNLSQIYIYHDYIGISQWAVGAWKTNNHLTQGYRNFYLQSSKHIKIHFIKVKSHSNIKYNEYADKLAKKAIEDIKNKDIDI